MRNPLASGVEMAVLRRRHRRGTFRSTNRQETRNFHSRPTSLLDYINIFFLSGGLETPTHSDLHTHTPKVTRPTPVGGDQTRK